MFTPPLDYSELNLLAGTYTPSTCKRNSKAFRFWCRALFQRAISVIEFEGFPEEWKENKDKWNEWLFLHGFLVITEDDAIGKFFNPCSFYGYNLYYKPTDVIITNPALNGSLNRKIGVDAALIKLSPDYMGIMDIIVYYAEKLSLLDGAQNVCLINSKVPFFFGAKNRAAAEAIKKMLDKVNSGEPVAIFDSIVADDPKTKESPFHFFKPFEGKDYITDKLLQDTATVLNQFDTEIGIQTLPYQKAERMITSEAESKKQESIARCTTWIETINDTLTVANKLFDLNIKAKLKFNGGDTNGQNNIVGLGEVPTESE